MDARLAANPHVAKQLKTSAAAPAAAMAALPAAAMSPDDILAQHYRANRKFSKPPCRGL